MLGAFMAKEIHLKKKVEVTSISYKDKFLSELLRLLPLHVFWKDVDGVYLGCNEVFARGLGLIPSDIVGKTDYDLPVKKELSDLYRLDDSEVVKSRKEKLNIEEEQEDHNGKKMHLLTSKVPLIDKNDKVIGLLGVYSDITDIKTAKMNAEISSKAKSKFISNISHDLRTPITGMIGAIQGLIYRSEKAKEEILHQDKSSAVNFIVDVENHSNSLMSATESLLSFVNDTLENINIDSGKNNSKNESFSIEHVIQEIVKMYDPFFYNKNDLKLSFKIHPSLPEYIIGDRVSIKKILLNLLSNAVKFTKKGYIKIEVNVEESQTPTDTKSFNLILSVKDTGLGIPSDKFDIIFDKFERLTPSYEGNYKGSGLGLYSVRKYVYYLGGTITVDSTLGEGSVFSVKLPIISSSHSDFNAKKFRLVDSKNNVVSKKYFSEEDRILIVEDNEIAALAVKIVLDTLKVKYDHVTSGKLAIEKVHDNAYGLIFMDIGLPDISGIDVTKTIRQLDDNTKNSIPVVALTGHVEKNKECISSGMQDTLIKPAQPKEIEEIVRKYIN